MKYLAFAFVALFVLLTSITDASAVVCARGVRAVFVLRLTVDVRL
jgi:hypothetical protein